MTQSEGQRPIVRIEISGLKKVNAERSKRRYKVSLYKQKLQEYPADVVGRVFKLYMDEAATDDDYTHFTPEERAVFTLIDSIAYNEEWGVYL